MPSQAVGKPLPRRDGHDKVTGRALYTGDHAPAHVAHAVIVQSTIARGRITACDTSAARRVPGVLAVLTHENAPRLRAPKKDSTSPQDGKMGELLLPLSSAEVHFAGQHVACVIAETLEAAQEGAARVHVRYSAQTPVLDAEAARSSATMPHAALGGGDPQYRRGDVDTALQAPGVTRIDAKYIVPVETNNPMEPSVTVAEWDGDELTLHDSTQSLIGTRNLMAWVFELPQENVRVVCPFTGGAFGCKGHQWPHTLLAAMAARVVRRPVKLALTRGQMFTSVGHRPFIVQELAVAAAADGRLTAIRHHTLNATSPLTEFVAPCGATTSKLLYTCENVETPNLLVRVNVGAPTPMRAPAEAPATFALESALDELAAKLGLDPLELRRRNHAEREPASGKPWSSKHLLDCYRIGAEKFEWSRRTPEPRSMRDGDQLVGWGMATAFYPGHRRPSSARIRLEPDGRALVQASTQEIGGGTATAMAQVAADALGLPVERVRFELGDTRLPEAPFSAGSVTAASVSEGIVAAAEALRAKLVALLPAGSALDGIAAERLALRDGRLVAADDAARGVALRTLVERAGDAGIEATGTSKGDEQQTKTHAVHSFGAHFCEVRIDPAMPRVHVARVVSVVDVGRVLNLQTARSQVIGGVVWGVGMALMEHTVYDPRTGLPVNANFADYRIPVNADIGQVEVEFVDEPDPIINSLGARGAGEIGITGAAAAVANAVFHATGRRVRELPITPDKLLA